jgi:glutamate synthase domain-containing protein 3
VSVALPIANTDRSVGTRLSGEVADINGDAGLDRGQLKIRLSGTAGQSFGAFLAKGIDIDLDGVGNDYVGKGMGGGSIAIRPFTQSTSVPQGAGNACLYGATGGELFIAGAVGQRFAVRNSGATAVVEGTSDHPCEYMTGGRVVSLGPVGRNIAAGMTGGVLFLHDVDMSVKAHISDSAPAPRRLDPEDAVELYSIIETHVARTSSQRGTRLLADWETALKSFAAPEDPRQATSDENQKPLVARRRSFGKRPWNTFVFHGVLLVRVGARPGWPGLPPPPLAAIRASHTTYPESSALLLI